MFRGSVAFLMGIAVLAATAYTADVCNSLTVTAFKDAQYSDATASGSCSGSSYSLTAKGHDFWWCCDRGGFAYVTITGSADFAFSARLSTPPSCTGHKVGISVRNQLISGSQAVQLLWDANANSWIDFYRTVPNLSPSSTTEKTGFTTANISEVNSESAYLKIERKSGTYSSSISSDGSSWTGVHTGMSLGGNTIYAGLALSCHGASTTATFENVQCTGCSSSSNILHLARQEKTSALPGMVHDLRGARISSVSHQRPTGVVVVRTGSTARVVPAGLCR